MVRRVARARGTGTPRACCVLSPWSVSAANPCRLTAVFSPSQPRFAAQKTSTRDAPSHTCTARVRARWAGARRGQRGAARAIKRVMTPRSARLRQYREESSLLLVLLDHLEPLVDRLRRAELRRVVHLRAECGGAARE